MSSDPEHEHPTTMRYTDGHGAVGGRRTPVDPSLYLNRELSWLDFNDRVLQLAEDERVPLLERVKFCAIYTTNLDEFYMVRVAGLRDQIDAGVENPSQDGLIPSETIALIRERVLELEPAADRLLRRDACARRWPTTTSSVVGVRRARRGPARGARQALPEGDLPGAHAAGGRARAARSPTSRTCRSAWPCSSATRSPTRRCSRA